MNDEKYEIGILHKIVCQNLFLSCETFMQEGMDIHEYKFLEDCIMNGITYFNQKRKKLNIDN
jgi:ABC-type enterochelin transport system permease subunit